MEQTAVDYLVKEISVLLGKVETNAMQDLLLADAIERAKAMFENQIIDAYETSHVSMMTSEQYYKETFRQ